MRTRIAAPAVAAALVAAGAATVPVNSASAALPVVNMGAVAAAAQAESVYGNKSWLGDDSSTRLVQSALRAKGYATATDGWYGPGTTEAYKSYQVSLGHTGTAADGQPGVTSLGKLGTNRFSVANKVNLGSKYDSYGGKRVNTRTRAMLAAADAKVSWSFRLVQGSYNPGRVSGSAGTHDGGGSADISVTGWTSTQRWQAVKALRTVGFAAWYRPANGSWSPHIHAMAIGDTDMAPVGVKQVADYAVGKDGLASHGPDNTPTAYRVPFTWWEKHKGL